MSNALFPKFIGLTWDIKKRPRWNTIVQAAVSGREVRIPQQVMPIWEFELVYSVLQDKAIPPAAPVASLNRQGIGGGSLPATTYWMTRTWVTSAGESSPEPEQSDAFAASVRFEVFAPDSPPANAAGFNVYVGLASGGEVLQNAAPIALAGNWTEPTTGLIAGLPPPSTFTDFDTLASFYLQRQGAFDSFLLYDPTDNQATGVNFGTGDGTTTAFQLVSKLGGFNQVQQNVLQVSVFDNGTQLTTGYTVGPTGIVTFTTPPTSGHALTATFGYFYRVRFKEDIIEFNEFLANLWEMKQLNLVSIKL